ncbi:MAG: hypothetical protein IJ138_00230 [Clostridia bacterium]|nr:hypothetical protein [Clostridia bacterium]
MRRYLLNEPSVLSPDYPMGLTSAIHFLSINGYIIGKQLNYNKLTTDAVELATELFFSDIEKMSSTFLVCEAKGDVAECYELVRALYRRHRIRLPEKIRAFAAVPWLWKEYLRMVTNQLTILLDVCEESDQIYELEEYEE